MSAETSIERVKILVVLQNAYDRGRLATSWNPTIWKRELLASRTGTRLRVVFSEPAELEGLHFCNAAPGLGKGPSEARTGSPSHVRQAIRRVKPDYILACGRVAEETTLQVWEGHLLTIPHPTYRPLTNDLLQLARKILVHKVIWEEHSTWRRRATFPDLFEHLDGTLRLALRQRRGHTEIEGLDA